MNPSSEEIRNEILHTAQEWGLHPWNNRHDAHFCDEANRLAVASLHRPASVVQDWTSLYEKLKETRLPEDQDDAIRVVLRKDLEEARGLHFGIVRDTLGMNYQPFFRVIKKGHHINPDKISYFTCKEYRKFTSRQLYPFDRFSQDMLSAEQWYHEIWYNDRSSLDGKVFEAIVAHHMEYNMACINCTHQDCLRWNAGFSDLSSWSDVVCLECHATYEIKSKQNVERVKKLLKFNSNLGGSFTKFYKFHPGKKRYLVLVSREASINREKSRMTHDVTIGEILKVLPRFTGKSFVEVDDEDEDLHLTAYTELKRETVKESWFTIPEYQGDSFLIAEEVYTQEYGPGKWDTTNPTFIPSPSSDSAQNVDQQKNKEEQKVNLDQVGGNDVAPLDESGSEGDASKVEWEELCYGAADY